MFDHPKLQAHADMLSLEFDQLKKKSLEIGHANATTKSLNQQHETTLIALRVDHQAISETVYWFTV